MRALRSLPWRRLLLGMLAAGGVVVVAGVCVFLWYRPGPRQIELRGKATAMGRQYGNATSWSLDLLVSLYLHKIQCNGDPELIAAREKAAAAQLANWRTEYRDELAGVSEATGIALPALAYGNSFLDMGAGPVACRALVSVDGRGRLRHCHNLDWDSLAGLARWNVTVVRRYPADGRYPTVSVGFPGLIGSLDIVNNRGIALSFNQLGFGRQVPAEPVFVSMRRIAETCSSWDQARQELLNLPEGMPFIITLSAAESGRASIFERTNGPILERPLTGSWIAAGNWGQAERNLPSIVDQTLQALPLATDPDLQHALATPPVLASNNLYSLIIDFQANTFYLASGSIPAGADSYRRFVLFP